MSRTDDRYEALYLMSPDSVEPLSAGAVRERLGLTQDIRTIQRWARRAYGTIPTRESMRRDPERAIKVRALEAEGLSERYCSIHSHLSYWPCLIRRVDDAEVFVCRRHARRGDV